MTLNFIPNCYKDCFGDIYWYPEFEENNKKLGIDVAFDDYEDCSNFCYCLCVGEDDYTAYGFIDVVNVIDKWDEYDIFSVNRMENEGAVQAKI